MWRLTSAVLLLSTVAITSRLDAQVFASELASVSQTIDGTTIAVTYYRPQSRGRTGLFGTRVYWGAVWTPGANTATTIRVSKDITLEGKVVPAGTYSVWIVVQPGPSEMVLDKDTMLAHTRGPKPRTGQIRFPVKSRQAALHGCTDLVVSVRELFRCDTRHALTLSMYRCICE